VTALDSPPLFLGGSQSRCDPDLASRLCSGFRNGVLLSEAWCSWVVLVGSGGGRVGVGLEGAALQRQAPRGQLQRVGGCVVLEPGGLAEHVCARARHVRFCAREAARSHFYTRDLVVLHGPCHCRH